jgi:hypothetical protein
MAVYIDTEGTSGARREASNFNDLPERLKTKSVVARLLFPTILRREPGTSAPIWPGIEQGSHASPSQSLRELKLRLIKADGEPAPGRAGGPVQYGQRIGNIAGLAAASARRHRLFCAIIPGPVPRGKV